MNLDLFAHMMNQQLAKRRIWPDWWEPSRWSWQKLGRLGCVWYFLIGPSFAGWTVLSVSPAIAVGRCIYWAGVTACLIILVTMPLEVFEPRLKREMDKHDLQLTVLALGSPRGALLTWYVADSTWLILRLIRYFPLFAIAAFAGGISWGNSLSFGVLVMALALTVVAVLYAATLSRPFTFVIAAAVIAVCGWWLYRNVDSSFLTFGASYDDYSGVLGRLLALAAISLAWAVAAIELRARAYRRQRGARIGRRSRLPRLLKRWPAVALLVHGFRGGLGVFGSVWIAGGAAFAGMAVGLIPWAGGVVLLIAMTFVVPQIVLAIQRAGVWEDVFLASDADATWTMFPEPDAKAWSRALAGACAVAMLPVLPGLIGHIVLGRYVMVESSSVVGLARQLTESGVPWMLVGILAASVVVFAVLCAFGLAAAFMVTALEDFVRRAAKRSIRDGASLLSLVALLLPVVAIATLAILFAHVRSPIHRGIWLASAYAVVGIVGMVIAYAGYRGLCRAMIDTVGLTTDDYAQAVTYAWRLEQKGRLGR